ncbi:hypothetical protein AO501_32810 [Mycobacterium gordonae]|uniref:Uncharacterized protein n=1 Tax=Mycobacterium gordonae TaxID=1778 RepID=A0A0Q2QJS2_MYCGO|nr:MULTISPECIES: hypothetical protein [Mycobacterium]KQH80141.1 hypothetical protein AO501_32810 [Mycobacterium gordonae]MDP7729700.1 hypothetical protein [Mycobacterium sp. TY813]
MSDLPTDIEVGDAHALRTFAVKDGRLTSIAQCGSHWKEGKCEAICLCSPDDPDHEVPSTDCTCGVYAFWTVEELLNQYRDFARRIVAVVRMDGLTIEGENGVKANAAQIVAWWCAEDEPELVAACVASAPGTRRYFDREVMIQLHLALNKQQPLEGMRDG